MPVVKTFRPTCLCGKYFLRVHFFGKKKLTECEAHIAEIYSQILCGLEGLPEIFIFWSFCIHLVAN